MIRPNDALTVETDEELLKLQEEFFRNKESPAARVIKQSKPPVVQQAIIDNNEGNKEPEEDVQSSPLTTNIIGAVIERTATGVVLPPSSSTAGSFKGGFPEPTHRSRFRKKRNEINLESQVAGENHDHTLQSSYEGQQFPQSVYEEIHQENLQRLENMSLDEILEAQAMLRQTLSPEVLKRLSSKRPKATRHSDDVAMEIDQEDDSMPLAMKEKYFSDIPAELDKLEWMGVTNTGAKSSSSLRYDEKVRPHVATAADPPAASFRFDFRGNLVEKNAEVPVFVGLHHHGDDPDQPGYTLAEMFHLMRSQVPSQRVIPLNVVSRILRKVRNNHYGDNVSRDISSWMIKMKAFLYLRTALDDTFETVLVAAIDALAAWVIGDNKEFTEEEHIWDRSDSLHRGYQSICLQPRKQSHVMKQFGMELSMNGFGVNDDDDDGESTEHHINLTSRDLVAGLLAMGIQLRFQYLLRAENLPLIAEKQMLQILLRFTRHSVDAAEAIADCHGLLEILHRKYISISWPLTNFEEMNITGYMTILAIRLWQTLCTASIRISRDLIENNYVETLLRYLVVDPSSLSTDFERLIGYEIVKEVLMTYRCLAAHGLYRSILSEAYTILRGWIMSTVYSLKMFWEWETSDDDSIMQRKLDIAIAFFSLMETLMQRSDSDKDNNQVGARPSEFVHDAIELLQRWTASAPDMNASVMDDVNTSYVEKSFVLISRTTGYLAAWSQYLSNYNVTDMSKIKRMWEYLALGEEKPTNLQEVIITRLRNLLSSSALLNIESWELPNLPGVYNPNRLKSVRYILSISTACDALFTRLSLIRCILQLFPEDAQIYSSTLNILTRNEILNLLQCSLTYTPSGRWYDFFGRWKTYLHHEWICCLKLIVDNNHVHLDDTRGKYLQMIALNAFALVPHVLPGDEQIALTTVEQMFDALAKSTQLLDLDFQECQKLWPFYRNRIINGNPSEDSSNYFNQQHFLISLDAKHNGLPLSKGWIFIPIDEFYSKADIVVDDDVKKDTIQHCLTLAWQVLGLYDLHQDIVDMPINPAITVISLMKIFLIEGEVYRNSSVELWIEKILNYYILKDNETIDYSSSTTTFLETAAESVLRIPFYQLFTDFTAAYAAESLGHRQFARLVLTPLSGLYSVEYKMLVWSELYDVLGTISVTYEEVICIGESSIQGFHAYFWPIETNRAVLENFVRALVNFKISKASTPFLYWMVIHHLSGFIFWRKRTNQNDESFRIVIARAVYTRADQGIINDWIGYTEKNFQNDRILVSMPECFGEVESSQRESRIDWLKSICE
ncbi:11534_t:CDS:1 [Paraglomus brasilianum]|uniref:11534_t:CDS:1 n=1 Tax=Paraglomus brasilianum TaxID=144538 RepID=A0A9N8YZF2_9GLOM|nr:11534_t:CDS:1 [Paraglomus brasilianum]